MKNKYFPTKSDCVCTLNSLNPKDIKEYYKKNLNSSKINPKQFYIEVSKLLGFKAWDSYQNSYQNEILPFMQKNELINYAPTNNINILKSYHDISFNYRELSDRIFLSKKPLPKSIFTGYDCKTDFIHHYCHSIINKNTMKMEIPNISIDEYKQLLEKNNLDLLIPVEVGSFYIFKNLLGDAFFKYDENYNYEYIFEEYMGLEGLHINDTQIKDATKFHNTILSLKKGWIEIIQFNENLIFLKAQDGNYDFVFKNIRDDNFTSPYYDFIEHDNIPTLLNEDYDFERWLYYGYKDNIKNKKYIKPYELWEQMDRHLSEINFYETNENKNYSSPLKILKDYYTKEKKYSYDRKITDLNIDGFESFKIDGKVLNVSNLITINEFKEFYKDNYRNTRSKTLDEIFTVNDDNVEYPVSVTWYDAIAYCKYIENKYQVPARLITLVEYENICPTSDKIYDTQDRLSFNYKNKEFDGIPSYMSDFENVIMRYKKPLEYIENKSIQFPTSATFFEWTNNFRSDHVEVTSERSLKLDSNFILSASSNNKYKYVKVGFRVCYELQEN